MSYSASDHTFAVCAYGKSKYIEACIKSVTEQTTQTKVIICTSTPSTYLSEIALKYGLRLFVNSERVGFSNIALDWNYAIECADTSLVTIAHQDDIYKKDYVTEVLDRINKARRPLIAFSDYAELRGDKEVSNNRNLNIKRVMLWPLKYKWMWGSIFVRRRILSLGSPICCPSVTYVKDNIFLPVFMEGYKVNLDWQAWERLSRLRGDFVFVNSIKMVHRIHEDSETTRNIKDSNRSREDFEMFKLFWPDFIARILEYWYARSEDQNKPLH